MTVLMLMLCYCGAVDAHGPLRCKGKIIRPGATMTQVLALCGPPTNQIVEEVPVRTRIGTGFSRLSGVAVTEYWEYDRGWGRFPAVLKFQDGTVARIDYLRYRSGAR